MKKIITNDGTETLFNEKFNEAYHSIKAGAFTESLYKFVLPCKINKLAGEKEEINILDVGFGLGYNIATAIYVAKNINPNVKLNFISTEIDKNILEKIRHINPNPELQKIYQNLLNGKFSQEKIGDKTFDIYSVSFDNVNVKIIFADARLTFQALHEEEFKFDAVFYDAFSPKVNAEMWTLDIFKIVYELMTEKAILATYSAALSVRKALIEVGFSIGLVEPVGRKSYSTVASKSKDIPPVPEKELKRILTSPFAQPMRDETLSKDRDEIYKEWEEKVNRKKALLSKGF